MNSADVAAAVQHTLLDSAKRLLCEAGVLPPPQLHLFTDEPDVHYAGCVLVRKFDPGEDAALAIRALGRPSAALPASRILLIWEQVDLLTALGEPISDDERALVFLEATPNDHTVTWYPCTAVHTSQDSVEIEWGLPLVADRPNLPGPIGDVLDIWREFSQADFATTVKELERDGYHYGGSAGEENDELPDVYRAIEMALETGEPTAVDTACRVLRDALAAMSERDPRRGLYLVDLSMVLQLRYENSGDLDDLADSVRMARAAESFPDGGTSAKRFNVLGTALRTWYERTGELDALRDAITANRHAVDVIPPDDPNFGVCLANLAVAHYASFQAEGDPLALAAAVSAGRRAAAATEVGSHRHEVTVMSLANSLLSHYELSGDLTVLTEAIDLARSATATSTASGWPLAARLNNLGIALIARYRRTGDLDSLREAILRTRQAVSAAPPAHADRTIYQLNLSDALRILADRTHDRAVLDEALVVARDAVDATEPRNLFRVNHIAILASIHQMRYAWTSDVAELDAAVDIARDALTNTPAAHLRRPGLLCTLGDTLHARSRHTGEVAQLDEAIDLLRQALDIVGEAHPDRSVIQRTMADAYRTRHEQHDDPDALPVALDLFRAAAAHRAAPIRVRVDAAREGGAIAAAAGMTALALDCFGTAVELLPLLAARSLHRYDSEYWLGRYGGLASDAAALALIEDNPARALELLELGRTVLISQALDIRTDLAMLAERAPQLADRFELLSARLEADDREQSVNRRAAADELDTVIAEARALPGMDRFLLPPKATDLLAQAGQGPIVMINVSDYRCDALVLTRTGLLVRSLPDLTPAVLRDRVPRFLTAVEIECASAFRTARDRGERVLAETLDWLWTTVCAPVLDTVRPTSEQRLWWIPTGLLSFLPLHAAGRPGTGESTADRVVSSCTPSIRALTHARTAARHEPGTRTLVVAMPHTPNAGDLPGAEREARLVAERAPRPRTLIGPHATRDAVAAALPHSTWAHFACHATTAASPSDNQLILHDHEARPLTASAISRLRLDSAALAYLSACHTSVSTTELADEVIHIASAFHLAGYSHVIGTLWSVNDEAATTIAELIYTKLTADGPDPNRAAAAVHDALITLRATHPGRPSLWASHIHIGI